MAADNLLKLIAALLPVPNYCLKSIYSINKLFTKLFPHIQCSRHTYCTFCLSPLTTGYCHGDKCIGEFVVANVEAQVKHKFRGKLFLLSYNCFALSGYYLYHCTYMTCPYGYVLYMHAAANPYRQELLLYCSVQLQILSFGSCYSLEDRVLLAYLIFMMAESIENLVNLEDPYARIQIWPTYHLLLILMGYHFLNLHMLIYGPSTSSLTSFQL